MSINSIGSSSQLNQIKQMDPQQMMKKMEEMHNKGIIDSADFSEASKMMSYMSGLDSAGKQEMKEFRNTVMQSVQSGNVNYAELVSQAPDSLKSFAEGNGIDLEKMIGKMAKMKDMHKPNFNPDEISLTYGKSSDEENNIIDLLFPEEEDEQSE